MYRKSAELMQFEQDIGSLDRNEIKGLERELYKIYSEYQSPTTELALLRRNGIYNTELLEQKLEIVRGRRQSLDERFKVQDQIAANEKVLHENNWGNKIISGVSGISSILLFSSFELVHGPDAYMFLGGGVVTAIGGTAMCMINYFYGKKAKAKLKQLKESPEYLALQESEKQKLPIAETDELKQLPSLEYKALPEKG